MLLSPVCTHCLKTKMATVCARSRQSNRKIGDCAQSRSFVKPDSKSKAPHLFCVYFKPLAYKCFICYFNGNN